MKKSEKKSRLGWEDIRDFCETLTEDEDALTRDMVSRISDKWSLWTMSVIAQFGQPMRFSRIMDQVDGISQKSLTKTLRGLERDGLVIRKVFAESPEKFDPRDYLKPAREAMKKVVAERMNEFGQAGHSGDYGPISLAEMAKSYLSGKLDTRPSLAASR